MGLFKKILRMCGDEENENIKSSEPTNSFERRKDFLKNLSENINNSMIKRTENSDEFEKNNDENDFTKIDENDDEYINDTTGKNTDKKKKKSKINSLTGLFDGIYSLKEKINSENFIFDNSLDTINSLDVPKILLVGTQTSGKTSLLNNIIGEEILPTGEQMVTRTPLYVSLRQGKNKKVKLFLIENGNKNIYFENNFTKDDEIVVRRELIKKINFLTKQITVGDFNISDVPIFLEITKEDLIDLTIVDLPGIVTLARTDKGQPPTIVDDIKNLIIKHISSDNVFVITVINSGNDLETDNGLSLVKSLSSHYPKMKTMGVLTKVDLVDKKSLKKFENILTLDKKNDVAISLDYGYYILNNTNDKAKWYQDYFSLKSQVILQRRYGIENILENLIKNTNLFLLSRIHPLKRDLIIIKNAIKKTIPIIGNEGENEKAKLLYIMNNCYILSREVTDSINSIGNNYNIGNKIKLILDDFEKEMNLYDPYNKANFNDLKLRDIIDSFEGFSQNSKNINLVLHKCFIDKETGPFPKIKVIFLNHIEKLYKLIIDTFSFFTSLEEFGNRQSIINQTDIKNYPKIIEFMENNNRDVLDSFKNKSIKIIDDYVSMQMNRNLWCDENDLYEMEDEINNFTDINQNVEVNAEDSVATKKNFKNRRFSVGTLKLFEEPNYNTNQIRCLINIIFKKIKKHIKELSYNSIYSTFILGYNYNIFHYLMNEINNMDDIDELFFTSIDKKKEVHKKIHYLDEIDSYIEFINNYEN